MPCSPGMRRCVATCAHRRFVRDYRAERSRQETVADHTSLGHAEELAAYLASNPLVTFKTWLIQHKALSPEDAMVEPTPNDWEPPPGF